jgi:hypothetical protein
MQDIWLPPETKNSKVVGMFVDEVHEYTNREGVKCERTVTVLRHKVPGSQDVSASLCKDNPDGAKLKKEWPKAWELYEAKKAKAGTEPPPVPTATEYGIRGTPIEDADFIGKDKLTYLKHQGFLTLEQLRDMSDAQCQSVGFGAKSWRKKAAEMLIVKADEAKRN